MVICEQEGEVKGMGQPSLREGNSPDVQSRWGKEAREYFSWTRDKTLLGVLGYPLQAQGDARAVSPCAEPGPGAEQGQKRLISERAEKSRAASAPPARAETVGPGPSPGP